MLLPDKKHAGSFGAEHPFVSVRREKIDRCAGQVERDDSQSLNRVDAEQGAAMMTGIGEFIEVVPPASDEADPTGGDDSRPLVDRGQQPVDRTDVGAGITLHDADFDASRNQASPDVSIRRELAAGEHDVVPRLPRKRFCDDRQAARRVRDEGNFARLATEQPRGRVADGTDSLPPLGPIGVPVIRDLVGPVGESLFAGRLSGVTAAWSKYAQRSATGI